MTSITFKDPIDLPGIFLSCGLRRGKIAHSGFLNQFAIFDGDNGVDLNMFENPYIPGNTIVRDGKSFIITGVKIEDRQWVVEAEEGKGK
jgi:hypothetical protein